MMLLELATGMRRGEICALQWDDLNLRTGELHIQRQVIHVAGALHESAPKTKSSDRVVILPPAVMAVLRELKEQTDSRWMFPSTVKEDAPLDPQSVYRKMKKVLARAQCKDIRFHDLRHTSLTPPGARHGVKTLTLSSDSSHRDTIEIMPHHGAMQQEAHKDRARDRPQRGV
jgi:integrase